LTKVKVLSSISHQASSEGTGWEIHGYSAMQRAWDIELIFPVKDVASAALMVIKADCLHNAGVISDGEKQWVYSRARPFLPDETLKTQPDRTSRRPDRGNLVCRELFPMC
jgi:hypothetical protein